MICFWEDDALQLRFPHLADSTNVMSLAEAQRSYAKFGAVDERFALDVRSPSAEERLDDGFRPLSELDSFEAEVTEEGGPEEATSLYYWRPAFWRRGEPGSGSPSTS
jgi:Cysteine-rich CPCC